MRSSWEPWRAFLEALQALPMSAEHLAATGIIRAAMSRLGSLQRYAELLSGDEAAKSRSPGADRHLSRPASSIIAPTLFLERLRSLRSSRRIGRRRG